MRRFLAVLFVVLACLVVAPSAAPQPPPPEPFPCAVFSTGQAYGKGHVSPMAQGGGIGGGAHVPGHHRGFSQCVP
jgi:hypothetical protein